MNSLSNVLLATSNVIAVYPLKIAYEQNDYISMGCIGFVGAASFVSHLFQSHKQNQIGFGTSMKMSKWLNAMDLLGCGLMSLRLIYLYWNSKKSLSLCAQISLLLSVAVNIIAESCRTKNSFVLAHSCWHLVIFFWIGKFIQKYSMNSN